MKTSKYTIEWKDPKKESITPGLKLCIVKERGGENIHLDIARYVPGTGWLDASDISEFVCYPHQEVVKFFDIPLCNEMKILEEEWRECQVEDDYE